MAMSGQPLAEGGVESRPLTVDVFGMPAAAAEGVEEHIAGFDQHLRHIPRERAAVGAPHLHNFAGIVEVLALTEALGLDPGAGGEQSSELKLPEEARRSPAHLLEMPNQPPFVEN